MNKTGLLKLTEILHPIKYLPYFSFFCYSHIKEHLKDVVDKPKEEMSEEELEFHYFKLHDYDKNNKLDGVEIVKAITHFHGE